ncbi:MAG TPA: hypothetical protein V6D48_23720 [Oculatellaceae cyanobacterium]
MFLSSQTKSYFGDYKNSNKAARSDAPYVEESCAIATTTRSLPEQHQYS